ncbi:MAG: CarD family transcriptional regulator [Lachnospiraceae bacterium]|nr:CarD family transcriptional regulator [Lachnospiraceae bacterium]
MKRYEVGDYIVHESSGVCRVVEICEKALQGRGSEKLYYSLEPVFSKGTRLTTPVDTKVRIRDVFPPEEFEELLNRVPTYPVLHEENARARTEMFKEEIAKFDIDALGTVLKTVYLRKEKRIAEGKKVMASDEKIMNIASKKLFEEMAFSMDVSMEEIADRFYERIIPERDEMIRQLDVE